MKFRIVEKRGVFRIRRCERVISFDKPFRFKNWAHNDDIHLKWGNWATITEPASTSGHPWDEYRAINFDTYQKAEDYIKEHYGLRGVKAIE